MGWLSSLSNVATQAFSEALEAGSEWGSLHTNLIAAIRPCDLKGNPIEGMIIKAPIKEGTFQQSFQWQSPFDDLSAEKRNPRLAAQSAAEGLSAVLQALSPGEDGQLNPKAASLLSTAKDFMDKAQTRSGITKLNSRQVYSGHEPMEFNLTLVFRAYKDPYEEVEKPVKTLIQMAYPQHMADSMLENAREEGEKAINSAGQEGANASAIGDRLLEIAFPSVAPLLVSFKYKGVTIAPLVIEDISHNLTDPHSLTGDTYKEVTLRLSTLHSWDAKDIANAYSNTLGSAIGQLSGEALNAATKLFKG